jgi:hypothetical protein
LRDDFRLMPVDTTVTSGDVAVLVPMTFTVADA